MLPILKRRERGPTVSTSRNFNGKSGSEKNYEVQKVQEVTTEDGAGNVVTVTPI